MSDAVAAGLISAVVAVIVGVFTARQSRRGQEAAATAAAKAAVDAQTVSSRTQIEEQAFTRAAAIYNETIDRQQSEHEDDQSEIVALKGRVRTLESEKTADRRKIGVLEARVARVERDNEKLRSDLSVATRLLGEKYPDEP